MEWRDDYCILKIVARGLDPRNARPLEAAVLRVTEDREVDSLEVSIRPGPSRPPDGMDASGGAGGSCTGGLPADRALRSIRSYIGDLPTLAHAPRLMEEPLLERFGLPPPAPFLDIRELSWLVAPYLRDHTPASLSAAFLGETPSQRAGGDARRLLRILLELRVTWREAPPELREAVLLALDEARSPWRSFLGGKPGTVPFPDLISLIPRIGSLQRGEEPEPLSAPSREVREEEIRSILAPGGALASQYPDHEIRPQQEAMALAANRALEESAFLVVEAGTGVGKSLAYLIPGVLHARRGGGPLVVSTYTRNLQEQLFHRDLPLLSRCLGSFEFSLLKGRSNYLCLRKWSDWCRSLSEGRPLLQLTAPDPALSYALLTSWAARTSSGDLEEISLDLRALLSDLLKELSSSHEDCLRQNCRFYASCWVERARFQACRSDVVVVNHALLLSQIGEGESGPSHMVLPEHVLLVADEAHHLEDVATEAFTSSFSLGEGLRIVEDIDGPWGILQAWRQLRLKGEGRRLADELSREASLMSGAVEDFFAASLPRMLPGHIHARARGEGRTRHRLTREMLADPLWEEAGEAGEGLRESLLRLSTLLADLARIAVPLEEGESREDAVQHARKAEALTSHALEAACALEVFLRPHEDEEFLQHLRWIELASVARGGRSPNLGINCAPVEVGRILSDMLFRPLQAAVLTSASLRVPGGRDGFSFFMRRTGLDILEESGREMRLLHLDSPFDYSAQVRMIAVSDLPDPSRRQSDFRGYMEEIRGAVEEVLLATGGKALVLLTSHQQVEYLSSNLGPTLEKHGLYCMRQRKGEPNALLLERFRAERDSVLLATEAFWEGVDVPGESLSAVIVAKLPFRYPEDPIIAGRVEHHDRTGAGGWSSYYAPLAVTLFRQGIGRLVRRSTDRGVIVVLDPRFLTRSYSRLFQDILPPGLQVETVSRTDLGEAIARAFRP